MNISFFRGYLYRLVILIILGLLSFEFYMYLKISKERRNHSEKKYVRDYEVVLCNFIRPKKRVENPKNKCPGQGIVTSFRQGGLARNMWQYANVLAISVTLGLDAYLPFCLVDALGQVFTNVSIPLLSEIGHCFLPLPDSASSVEDWTSLSQSIVIKSEDLYGDVVLKYLELIRTHFVFKPSLRDNATAFLLSAKHNITTSVTYIGVYITKTSIIVNQEYDDVYPSLQFFVDSMQHFRKDYPDALFVVITDRKNFWEYVFGTKDVYVVDEESFKVPGMAMAVLSYCNHSILASDDFAVWSAILCGGEAIVSLCMADDFNGLMQYNKHWSYLLNNTKSVNKLVDRIF